MLTDSTLTNSIVVLLFVLALGIVGWMYVVVGYESIKATWAARSKQPDVIDQLHELVANHNLIRKGIPDYFSAGHTKARLVGQDDPCRVCATFRGRSYAFGDREAPQLPLPDCEHARGCTCEYV